ncbi:hypothetical protein KAT21_04500 [Candidatus Bathyarchaeota archaeon]|nr:hypothetical protein [Candidatus Bathyarchaeota archaeon]
MFENIFNVVVQAIEEWVPKKRYSMEAGYRSNLMNFLRERLKHREEGNIFGLGSSENYIVRKEFGSSRADIAVINSEKIGIEIKFNFSTKRQRNTLNGQIKDYFREYPYVVIVLCGYVDTEQFEALRYDFREYEEPAFSLGQPQKVVKIISKSKRKTATARKVRKKTTKSKRTTEKKKTTKRGKRRKKEESIWDLF